MNRCARLFRTGLIALASVVALFAVSIPASAQLPGAIFTTDSTGTIVNGSLFSAKIDVYLNGGPQNQNAAGLPDGTYYFQVTDPSGAQSLSADDITCRQVVVQNQRFAGAPTSVPSSCTTGLHINGLKDLASGGIPVQLCPAATRSTDNLNNGTYYDPNNWCDTTNNGGGVYKAWLTPVEDYDAANAGAGCHTQGLPGECWGFIDATSKTKTFKVRTTGVAYVNVCKFNDLNQDGTQEDGEPPIQGWSISAIGVDMEGGPLSTAINPVTDQTDSSGCVAFSVSDFAQNPAPVIVYEALPAGWQQTAPQAGSYSVSDGTSPSDGKNVSVSVDAASTPPETPNTNIQSLSVAPGDNVTLNSFGNTCTSYDPSSGCPGSLNVTKTAYPSFTRTYKWTISKSVDTNSVFSAGGGTSSPAANFTVQVTHDSGTDSGWQVTGDITISNSSLFDIPNVAVTDLVDNGGACTIAGYSDPITVPAGTLSNQTITPGQVDLSYTCTYSGVPAVGTNTATASWGGSLSASGQAGIDFAKATITYVDKTVNVTDTLKGSLGSVTVNADGSTSVNGGAVDGTNPAQADFTYPLTFTDPAGTCTDHQNQATFTSTTIPVTGTATTGSSNTVKVTDCQGADLTVSKTVNPSYTSNITKTGPASPVEVSGTSTTLNYTITVTESGWQVTGTITVTNPNDWEDIPVTISDTLSGATCKISGSTTNSISTTVSRSSFAQVSYTCTFATAPAASGSNTATASWTAATNHTPDGSASSGAVTYTFPSLVVTDTFNNGTPKTLGTISTPAATTTYKDSYSVTNIPYGNCVAVSNTAAITGSSSTVNESVCNTKTGALTMGFWKNTNGQGIITNYCGGVSGTSLVGFLSGFNPFKDDTATTCKAEASYVANIIGAATCTSSTNTCNSMLRAQMLATALDVYFSTPTLGGNKIGGYTGLGASQPALGGVAINLSAIHPCADGSGGATCTSGNEDTRPEFGILSPCLGTTIGNMLAYANYPSGVNGNPVATSTTGASWYLQNKARQVPAKDSFDDFNNQIAPIAPTSCSSTF